MRMKALGATAVGAASASAGGLADGFEGGDLAVTDRPDRQHAGPYGLTIEMHGAGAALGDAAAEFRTGHAQNIAQGPEQRRVGRDVYVAGLAVDLERDHRIPQ